MTLSNRFDIVTVGHFVIDTISLPTGMSERTELGGSATYVSVAAAKLGAKVSVISKVGEDFPNKYLQWLRNNHVNLSGLKRTARGTTTKFSLKYQQDWRRRLQLKALAPTILVKDIHDSLRARSIHVAPIASELSTNVIQKLRKLTGILSLDPQGFVRDFDSHGNVRLKHWEKRSILELIDIYKSSQDELRAVTGIADVKEAARKVQDYGAKIVIATRGLQGSMVLVETSFYSVPACESKAILDPTGAGDAYIGAFLAEHIRGRSPYWCACVGSAAASFVVEGIGPRNLGSKKETYERARKIYLQPE